MNIHSMFQISLLEPYHVSIILGIIFKLLPLIEINGEQKYEMDKIIDLRILNH
jgi:hypothetical protein